MKDPVAFRNWLQDNTDLGDRAIYDTVSRVRRVAGFVDPLEARSEAEFRYRLDECAEFSALSKYVKSQLRRAGIRYREFMTTNASAET